LEGGREELGIEIEIEIELELGVRVRAIGDCKKNGNAPPKIPTGHGV
jgi:hypothetical protein